MDQLMIYGAKVKKSPEEITKILNDLAICITLAKDKNRLMILSIPLKDNVIPKELLLNLIKILENPKEPVDKEIQISLKTLIEELKQKAATQ